jgi:hypothetical protein
MTIGPLACAVALVPLSNVGADASYFTDVLPAVIVLGLGLSLTVAPLTSTALAAAQDRNAGLASGVNNAVARTGGLIAIAVLPLISGVGASLTDPVTLGPAYQASMLICAVLMTVGAVIALVAIPSSYAAVQVPTDLATAEGEPPQQPSSPSELSPIRTHCGIGAPPLHPPSTRQ